MTELSINIEFQTWFAYLLAVVVILWGANILLDAVLTVMTYKVNKIKSSVHERLNQ